MIATTKYDSDEVRIFINGLLHIHFFMKNYLGCQSYREIKYTIEIYLTDRTIRLEYDNVEHWENVLRALDEAL